MNVRTSLETNTEATEVMQPSMRAFNDPAIFAKAAAVFGTAPGDHRLNTAIAQRSSMSLGVVSSIGVDHTRSLQRVASQSANRRNRVNQRQQLCDIVDVRAGQDRGKRRAVGVGDDVVLGTGSRAIGWVWPSFGPPQLRESKMNRQRLARSRFGLLRAASRAAARANGPTHRQPANRVAVANMSRPSHNPSRQADRASAVRS